MANMFLFLMGTDLPSLGILILILAALSELVYVIARKIFTALMRNSSDRKIGVLSRFSAYILVPLILIGSFTFFFSRATQPAPRDLNAEDISSHYELIEQELGEVLQPGMSKAEVVEIYGDTDTTTSVLTYDLSLPRAEEKYLLEIKFDSTGLTEFKRR